MAAGGIRLGLLGGTFNPIHIGHLRAAEEVCEDFGLDRFVFIPAARPPHKAPFPLVSFEHRLAMVRLAIEARPGFEAADLENRRIGPSYTVDTLEYFREQAGTDGELFFITGMDAFLEISSWKDHLRLFELARFVVITRPGSPSEIPPAFLNRCKFDDQTEKYHWDRELGGFTASDKKPIYFRKVSALDISSTDIRKRVRERRSVRYLIPEAVRGYILDKELYLD